MYFISDAHLGVGNDSLKRERELCNLLDQIKDDAHIVVFLGDMFDFWFSYKYVVPRGCIRLLGKMSELADHGVELHYFIGNHDMWIFDYLASEMPIKMYEEPCIIRYDNKQFLCGHGDGLGHLDKKYDFLRRVFRSRFNQKAFAMLPPRLTFSIAQRWSRSSRQSHSNQENHYMGDSREGIVIYCKEQLKIQPVDYFLFGHRHTPLDVKIEAGNRVARYVNTGDWLNHRTYAHYTPSQGLQLLNYQA
ncbi:MAG: UDP-2,3-diacylglucosamine diphosphatase [Bacteroidales bacterium]|nr:UDP-2,3-diacylglucosamine diphosphatase [Candidatus Colimorpha onthohippi]